MSNKDCIDIVDKAILKYDKEVSSKFDNFKEHQEKIRHDKDNKYSKIHITTFERIDDLNDKIENNNKQNALLNQSHTTMSENLKEIKEVIKQMDSKMENFFKELPNNFATKEEHKLNTLKIDELSEKQKKWDKGFFWLMWIIWSAIVIALLNLILK